MFGVFVNHKVGNFALGRSRSDTAMQGLDIRHISSKKSRTRLGRLPIRNLNVCKDC